jgi:hypothetical protein
MCVGICLIADWFFDFLIDLLIYWLMYWLIFWLIYWLIEQIDWFIYLVIDFVIDWADWFIQSFIQSFMDRSTFILRSIEGINKFWLTIINHHQYNITRTGFYHVCELVCDRHGHVREHPDYVSCKRKWIDKPYCFLMHLVWLFGCLCSLFVEFVKSVCLVVQFVYLFFCLYL